MRGASKVTLDPHQILRLPRNSEFKIWAKNPWIASANIKTIRPWNRHLAPAASETLLVPSWRRILYGKIQHFGLRLSIQISRSAAPATKSDTPPSPNTAPATKSDSELLCPELLYAELLYSELLCPALLYAELLCSELVYAELLYSELLYSELLDCCDFKTS